MLNRPARQTVWTAHAASRQAAITALAAVVMIALLLPAQVLAATQTITIAVGESRNITSAIAEHLPKTGQPRYESGNAGFFTVADDGTITGVHEGVTALAIIAPDGTRTELRVEVKAAAGNAESAAASGRAGEALEGIVISNSGGQIHVGDVERIIAFVLPFQVIGANPFDITSSDPSVLRVIEHARVIEAVGEGQAVITATTPDGAHTATVTYTVVARPVESHPAEKTYTLEPERFGIRFDDASEAAAKANSAGLYQALLHTADNGFTRLLLPENSVLYVEPQDTIHMVSNVQLDLNGSEVKLRPNDYPRYAAFIFKEKEDRQRVLENASIVNGTITGERDEKEAHYPGWAKDPKTEGGCSIIFDEGRNNGIRNLTVRKSIGFNIASGVAAKSHGSVRFTETPVSTRNMEGGDFDDQGNPIDVQGKIRSKEPLDISKFDTPFYTMGYPLGYMGYPHVNSRIYDIWFYDAQMNLLGSQRGQLRYRQYDLPKGTSKVHLSFYHDTVPERGNSDFHDAFAFMENRPQPIRNYMIDCVIEDNYSTGFAACGGQGWLIKGNTFRNNGGRMPGCDIDWEDGWEYMQGDLIEGNTFESRLNVVTCAGLGFVFRNNTFRGESIFYGRTQHYSMIDNLFEKAQGNNAHVVKVSYASQSDIYAVGNIYRDGAVNYTRQHAKAPFIGTYEATFVNELFERSQLLNGHIHRMANCTFRDGPDFAIVQADVLDNCTFDQGSYLASGAIINSTLTNVTFRIVHEQALTVRDSTLINPTFTVSGAASNLTIENCRIAIDHKEPLVTPNGIADIIVRNTRIALKGNGSVFGGWDANGVASRILLDTVKFDIPSGAEVYLHKFAWYPAADDATRITYTIRNTDVSRLRDTDERGRNSNFRIERAGR